jgi:hypothetical protein
MRHDDLWRHITSSVAATCHKSFHHFAEVLARHPRLVMRCDGITPQARRRAVSVCDTRSDTKWRAGVDDGSPLRFSIVVPSLYLLSLASALDRWYTCCLYSSASPAVLLTTA